MQAHLLFTQDVKNYFIYCLLIFQCFPLLCQTCIIAKRTKNAIYVGLDSRVVNSYLLDGVLKKDTAVMCKIFTEGRFNFATSGSGLNESPNYVREACKKGGTFNEVIQRYSDSFREWILGDLVRLVKTLPPNSFFSFVKDHQPYYSNVIFWGIENDSLFLAMAAFTIELDNSFNINVNSHLITGDIIPAGHYDNIGTMLEMEETWKGDISKVIESLIKIEIEANPLEVGAPIHLLKMTTKNGLEWVSGKKPPCN